MSDWREMSFDCFRGAKLLHETGLYRRSISNSYYCAYCAVANELAQKGVRFPRGWNNPAHEQLPMLVTHNLSLPEMTRRMINKSIRILRRARENADYRPGMTVDRALALACLRNAGDVLQLLEIKHG